MLFLRSKLKIWQQEGLLSSEQADKILVFESTKAPSGNWIIRGAAMIGLSAIAIGFISLVASNWNQIPSQIKLGSYIGLHGILAWVSLVYLEKQNQFREVFLGLYSFFFSLASV